MSNINPPRKLLSVTFVFLLLLAGSVFYFSKSQLPPSIHIQTKEQPTIGYLKARVHVVVFEEPKCSHCKDFNDNIFPSIKKDFIDTNKIRYTVIPVSFLPGSMPAAVAALCIYNENPLYPNDELFFKFIDYMYRHQPTDKSDWATPQTLVKYAQATSPAIQLDKLKNCVEMEAFRVQIEKNTLYGQEIMDGTIITPTVYVNGIKVREITADEIGSMIKTVLEHEGVY
jgi:protein-disulfide isomerase